MTGISHDGLGWEILSFEEREFLEERGFEVIMSVHKFPSEIVSRGPKGMYFTARFELDRVLAAWGGDTIFQGHKHKRG